MFKQLTIALVCASSLVVASENEEKKDSLLHKQQSFFRRPRCNGYETHKGPILGWIAYHVTKAVCYGVAGAFVNKAAKTVISGASSTGVVPQPIIDTAVAAASTSATFGFVVPTGMVERGGVVVNTFVESYGVTNPAFHEAMCNAGAVGSAALVGQTGSVAGACSAIESAALAAKAIGDSLPTW